MKPNVLIDPSSRILLHNSSHHIDDTHSTTTSSVTNNMRTARFDAEANLGSNEDDESGSETPPLWPDSSSRAEAIARGQRELMEMVSNMPESSYELSLKDLVQNSSSSSSSLITEEIKVNYDPNRKKKVAVMKRSGSLDNNNNNNNGAFLLKTVVFPVPFGSTKRKNKKNDLSNKVSPRPSVTDNDIRTNSNGMGMSYNRSDITTWRDQGEWWKKRSGESRRSNNSGSSKSTGSKHSGWSSSSRHGSEGCWSFLRTKRKANRQIE